MDAQSETVKGAVGIPDAEHRVVDDDLFGPPAPPDDPPRPKPAVAIIADFYREAFRPVFRIGNTIHAADGSDVGVSVATAVPNSKLIDRLAEASDAPRYAPASGGGVKHDGLPAFFRKWAAVAFGDVLAELPDEDAAEIGGDSATAETFRRLVRDALLSPLSLGDVIDHTTVTQVQRRPMIGWCVKFAKLGPWKSIRDFAIWCKRRENADGEEVMQVAIRHELFAQLRADRRLIEMTATKWARRAARYGVGASSESDRPHGRKAVTLASDFMAELTAGVPDDDPSEICPQSDVSSDSQTGGQEIQTDGGT